MTSRRDLEQDRQADRFFEALWGEKEDGLILIWQRDGKRSHWLEDACAAATLAVELEQDVYTGVGLSAEDFGSGRRCPADRVIAVPGLWADIDIAGPVHKKSNLPPTEEAARELIAATGLRPTLLVHSGHGLQPWWLTKELLDLRDPESHQSFEDLAAGWQHYLGGLAHQRGWNIDSVGDLARLLRVPGSVNVKVREMPVPVRLLVADGPRYEDLAEFEERVAPLSRSVRGADLSAGDLDLGKLREDREPPADLIETLCHNGPGFCALWEHRRPDLPSQSEYDMAIAGSLVRAGCSNEEIVDALIAHRRRWAPESIQKALRKDYLVRTIRAVRNDSTAADRQSTDASDGSDGSDGEASTSGGGRESTAQALLRIVDASRCTFFHDPEKIGYAVIPVDDHVEVCPVRSRAFRLWLGGRFYTAEGKAASREALGNVADVLEARAVYDGACEETYVRVAHRPGRIYLDLANDKWQVVEVSADVSRVLDTSPVKFRRPRGMLPLPMPERGGDIAELRSFLNLDSDDTWYLVLGFATFSLSEGPYPVLHLGGEHGSSKSTTAKVIRLLIDPNSAPLRAAPKDERDLAITANNSWLVVLDNLSHLSNRMSDALCRLSTGGGFSTRELYENSEEVLFYAKRPCIITSIESVITNGDLLDRAVLSTLPQIDDEDRLDEKEFWEEFERQRARFLGALLDCVARTLRELPIVTLTSRPRMADFARWGAALERAAGWSPGSFVQAYEKNRHEANAVTLESSPVGAVLSGFMKDRTAWEGTATRLLEELEDIASEKTTRQKMWPRSARGLSGELRRLCPALRTTGLDVSFARDTDSSRTRQILIRKAPKEPSEPSEPSGNGVNQGVTSDGSDERGRSAPTNRPAAHAGNEGVSDGSDGPDGPAPTCPGPQPRRAHADPPSGDGWEVLA